MRRYGPLVAAIIVAMTGVSTFAANTLTTGGHNGIVRSQSADLLGQGGLQLGGALEYSREWDYIHSVYKAGQLVDRSNSPRTASGDLYFAVGLIPYLDLGLNLPMYWDASGLTSSHAKAVGDLEMSAKLCGIWLHGDEKPLTGAAYVAVQFPTGNENDGFFPRHAYYGRQGNWSAGQTVVHPMLISTLHFDRFGNGVPIQINFNVGGVFNSPEDNDAVTAALGFQVSPAEWITLFTDVSMEERFTTVHQESFFSDLINDPVFVTPGLKLIIPATGLFIKLAADFGISESDPEFAQTSGTETGHRVLHQANFLYNAYLALGWQKPANRDSDDDGIVDRDDKCPNEAEDKDGYQDDDGCADADNDGDGIADAEDKCPNQSGAAEMNGCPDNDGDGIADNIDKCPNEAEDKDNFQDDDGCADNDNDGDGVADADDKCPDQSGTAEMNGCPDSDNDGVADNVDQCPKEAEDVDTYRDEDGCPDLDNDGDGIPDEMDKCPKNPGVPETQGCPKTKEIKRGQLILKGVNFTSGKAVLLGGSYKVLDEMAESLREWPEVNLEIQGHTDNTGQVDYNRELSQKRADTVRQYLIEKGVAPERLTAVGYGPDKPIADNKTSSGRAQNRRVEVSRK